MALDFDKLTLQSYLETEYVLTVDDQKIIFHIGDLHPLSEHIFKSSGVKTYAWLTAWNPRSKILTTSENSKLMKALKQDLGQEIVYDGLSRSPDGNWTEQGLWVCDLSLYTIRELAVKYDQNAFTFAIMGHSMKLILV